MINSELCHRRSFVAFKEKVAVGSNEIHFSWCVTVLVN